MCPGLGNITKHVLAAQKRNVEKPPLIKSVFSFLCVFKCFTKHEMSMNLLNAYMVLPCDYMLCVLHTGLEKLNC